VAVRVHDLAGDRRSTGGLGMLREERGVDSRGRLRGDRAIRGGGGRSLSRCRAQRGVGRGRRVRGRVGRRSDVERARGPRGDEDGDRERAIEAGCNDYDVKPIELPRLLEKIAALGLRGGP
jgi:hypothetical protein